MAAKQRAAFVAMAVRRAAPFPDPEFGVTWSGNHASVWYWSRAMALELIGGQWPRRIECAPEALYLGAPEADSQQLLQLSAGVESRLWKEGRLTASRWWPQPPSPQEWAVFLRSAGCAPDPNGVPPVREGVIQPRRWSTTPARKWSVEGDVHAYLPRILQATGLLFALLFFWQTGSIVRAWFDTGMAKRAAVNLDEPLQRILAARETADRNLAAADELLALRTSIPQNRMMAEVTRVMGDKQWQVSLWHQPVADRIEVTLAIEPPDPEFLVSAWEASPLFRNVTTELSRKPNEVTVRADIVTGAAMESAP